MYISSSSANELPNINVIDGIEESFKDANVKFKEEIFRVHHGDMVEVLKKKAADIQNKIEAYAPDMLIVSSGIVFKYLVQPYYQAQKMPVIFYGIKWDLKPFNGPYMNTTGMVMVPQLGKLLKELRPYARGDRVGFLAADTKKARTFEIKSRQNLGITFAQTQFVTSFEEWKQAFYLLQESVDMLVLEDMEGLQNLPGWDNEKALAFVLKGNPFPVGTCSPGLMNYCLLGVRNVPKEQAAWVARISKLILSGTPPAKIAVVRNVKGRLMVNERVAKAMGEKLDKRLLLRAEKYGSK